MLQPVLIMPPQQFEGWDVSDTHLRIASRRVEAKVKTVVLYANKGDADAALKLRLMLDELEKNPNPIYNEIREEQFAQCGRDLTAIQLRLAHRITQFKFSELRKIARMS